MLLKAKMDAEQEPSERGWMEGLVDGRAWAAAHWVAGAMGSWESRCTITQNVFLFFLAHFHIDIILCASPAFWFIGGGVVESLPF